MGIKLLLALDLQQSRNFINTNRKKNKSTHTLTEDTTYIGIESNSMTDLLGL